MRGRLIGFGMAAVVVAGAVALAVGRGDGGSPAEGPPGRSAFETRSEEAGEVAVEATLVQLGDAGAVAEVVFDTHSVELDLDVAAGATLTVGGVAWPTGGWDGDGPGGHHREGELRFSAAGPAEDDAVLVIEGLSEPLTFRWPLP